MTTTSPSINARGKRRLLMVGLTGLILAGLLVAASVLLGYGLNVRALGSAVMNVVRAVRNQPAASASTGEFRNVVFLHHSVGHNLITEGGLRQLFTAAGYQFWDHDYNYPGLTNPAGEVVGYSYSVPGDNTDPDGLARIFSQPAYSLPLNTLSGLLQHEVILYKSCFPASAIGSADELERRKDYYRQMLATIDQHPDRLFILLTQPPLNPAETTRVDAQRARALADWLMSDEFRQGRANLFTFDLFGRLAESDAAAPDADMLRADYRNGPDSHPNAAANQAIAPQVVQFVTQSVEQFKARQ